MCSVLLSFSGCKNTKPFGVLSVPEIPRGEEVILKITFFLVSL